MYGHNRPRKNCMDRESTFIQCDFVKSCTKAVPCILGIMCVDKLSKLHTSKDL